MEILSIDHVVECITSYLDTMSKLNFLSSCSYLYHRHKADIKQIEKDNYADYNSMRMGMFYEILRRQLDVIISRMRLQAFQQLFDKTEWPNSGLADDVLQKLRNSGDLDCLNNEQQQTYHSYEHMITSVGFYMAKGLAPCSNDGVNRLHPEGECDIVRIILDELHEYWFSLTSEEYRALVRETDERDLFLEGVFYEEDEDGNQEVIIPWPEHWTPLYDVGDGSRPGMRAVYTVYLDNFYMDLEY